MWQIESSDKKINDEYKKIIKTESKKVDRSYYTTIQIFLSLVVIASSFMFKNGNIEIFTYVKDNYDYFFEDNNYIDSVFSYNEFIEKMKYEIEIRMSELLTVFNSRGSTGNAQNVSTKKIVIKDKGIIPLKGYISSNFGTRTNPFNKSEKEFHTGIDIAATKGSFIKASFDGTVSDTGYNSIAGNYIKIKSGDNIETFYAHNQFLFVKKGDRIVAGQTIATVGQTGWATGPHLHFEFIYDNIRYNPVYALNL